MKTKALAINLLIILGLVAFLPVATTGVGAFAPGALILPIIVAIALVPAVIFYLVTRSIIDTDTTRRLQNRGFVNLAQSIDRNGGSADNVAIPGVNMKNLNLEGFSIRRSLLDKSKMTGANCTRTDFTKTSLRKAKMNLVKAKNATFRNADLRGSWLRYANLKGANFENANLCKTNLKGANFKGANLKKAKLTGAVFNAKTTLPFSRNEAFDRGMIWAS